MKTIKTKKGEISLPCLEVKVVDIEMVQANNYNPNKVPSDKMDLLENSILSYGFCYAVVTCWDADLEKYVIVDGFHRYFEFYERLGAKQIPIIDLKLSMAERMTATVAFNRARGVHQVELMGDLVRALIEQGVPDEEIAVNLGMEIEEVFRLKQITGIAELFKKQIYSKAWEMMEVGDDVVNG